MLQNLRKKMEGAISSLTKVAIMKKWQNDWLEKKVPAKNMPICRGGHFPPIKSAQHDAKKLGEVVFEVGNKKRFWPSPFQRELKSEVSWSKIISRKRSRKWPEEDAPTGNCSGGGRKGRKGKEIKDRRLGWPPLYSSHCHWQFFPQTHSLAFPFLGRGQTQISFLVVVVFCGVVGMRQMDVDGLGVEWGPTQVRRRWGEKGVNAPKKWIVPMKMKLTGP